MRAFSDLKEKNQNFFKVKELAVFVSTQKEKDGENRQGSGIIKCLNVKTEKNWFKKLN